VAAALALLAIGAILGAAAFLQRIDPFELLVHRNDPSEVALPRRDPVGVLLSPVLSEGGTQLAGVVPAGDGWLVVGAAGAGTVLQRWEPSVGWSPDDQGDTLEFAFASRVIPLPKGDVAVVGHLQQRGVIFVRTAGAWTRTESLGLVLPEDAAAVDRDLWVVGWDPAGLSELPVVLTGEVTGTFRRIATDIPLTTLRLGIAAGADRVAIAGCDPDAAECVLRIVTLSPDGSRRETAALPATVVLGGVPRMVSDGRGFVVLVQSDDGATHVWRSDDGTAFRTVRSFDSGSLASPPILVQTASGPRAVGATGGVITVWPLSGTSAGAPWSSGLPMTTVGAVGVLGDRLFVTGDLDGVARGWELQLPADA
jgi:hypothetical protein